MLLVPSVERAYGLRTPHGPPSPKKNILSRDRTANWIQSHEGVVLCSKYEQVFTTQENTFSWRPNALFIGLDLKWRAHDPVVAPAATDDGTGAGRTGRRHRLLAR